MLYDPKWKKTETKADPYALASLISWMAVHRPDETYCYSKTGVCLIARYLAQALGFPVRTGFSTWRTHDDVTGEIPDGWVLDIARPEPHTFGAALERAHEFADSR